MGRADEGLRPQQGSSACHGKRAPPALPAARAAIESWSSVSMANHASPSVKLAHRAPCRATWLGFGFRFGFGFGFGFGVGGWD